jgi:hypothetical protein
MARPRWFSAIQAPVAIKLAQFCGTTDWARILTDTRAAAHNDVNQITLNVIRTLSDRPDFAKRSAGKHSHNK